MTVRRTGWGSTDGGECLVFGLAVGLAGVWAFSRGEGARVDALRHLFAVNALAAPLWGVVSRPVGRRWTTLVTRGHPDAPVAAGWSRVVRQTTWATGLWTATSALLLGFEGAAPGATTWFVLLGLLLVLGGLPLALEAALGVPRAALVVLVLASLTAAAVLGLSVVEPPPWPVRMWNRTPVKVGLAACLFAVQAISAVVATRSFVRAGPPSPGRPWR